MKIYGIGFLNKYGIFKCNLDYEDIIVVFSIYV